MKYVLTGMSLLMLVHIAAAQQFRPHEPQGMSQEQMQQMRQQMEQMMGGATILHSAPRRCEPMERLQQQSKKMQTEIEALCKLGKRDEAQATAMRYGQEIAASEDMQAIKNCGEMAQQMMQHMQMGGGAEGKTTHICDSAQNPDDED